MHARRCLLRRLCLPQEATSGMNPVGSKVGPCAGWDDESLSKLYDIFRRRMLEVYSENYAPNPWSKGMPAEFNAWQKYLREKLSFEVLDVSDNDVNEVVTDKGGNCWVKVMNPSNGSKFSRECIVVPADIAEKALALGCLPANLDR